MAEIPEELLRRSAEAKAKALGLPVEQVLAEMKGEAVPQPAAEESPEPRATSEEPEAAAVEPEPTPEPEAVVTAEPAAESEPAEAVAAAAAAAEAVTEDVDVAALLAGAAEKGGLPESLVQRSAEAKAKATGASVASVLAEMAGVEVPAGAGPAPSSEPPATSPEPEEPPATSDEPPAEPAPEASAEAEAEPAAVAVAVTPEAEAPAGNGGGNGAARVAASVTPRPIAAPSPGPEGVRTQRLLTVVKAKAIQKTKVEPSDKVSTWPHLMVAEFAALLAVTGLLIVMSVVLQAPLLEQANFNATPNPSKAPWYFLGLQELLSYFDPQIGGVTIPTIVGLFGFMAIPYVDRNPSNKPADRKFAIFLYTFFIMGAAVLTILGVLFRGPGFNFTYPWADGIWFDDLKDWVNFE